MFRPVLDALRRQYLGALALFVALGGTSYAAVTLDAGSVGSREIRNQSVKTVDIARGAVKVPPDRHPRSDHLEDRPQRDHQH